MNRIELACRARSSNSPELQDAAEDAAYSGSLRMSTPCRSGWAPADFVSCTSRSQRFVPADPDYCDEEC